jgi:hypothetical protein
MARIAMAACTLGLAVIAASVFAAPANNVSSTKHPNIAAAQHLTTQAYEKIVAAQKANEYDLGGHAAHAKELLQQANNELKLAAETSNAHSH